MAVTTLTKANISLGLTYSFRDSVHYCHGLGGAFSLQADMVLEKELRDLQLNQQEQEGRLA